MSVTEVPRKRPPGRPKGTPNKITRDFKAAVEASADHFPGEPLDPSSPFHAVSNPWIYPPGRIGVFCRLRDRNDAAWAALVRACMPKDFNVSVTHSHAAVAEMSSAFPPELVALASLDWHAVSVSAREKIVRALREAQECVVIDVEPTTPSGHAGEASTASSRCAISGGDSAVCDSKTSPETDVATGGEA